MSLEAFNQPACVGLALALFMPSPARADGPGRLPRRSSDQVLVVFNADSSVSKAIAEDYAGQRKVRNLLPVHCQDSALSTANETLTPAIYARAIEDPVRGYLTEHTNIEFIVLTKGIPIRVKSTDAFPSVDSSLAALDYTNVPGAVRINIQGDGAMGFAFSNRYWNATRPFSHARFGGFLVTRLDGYTAGDAMALVRRALAAEHGLTNGRVLLDVQPSFGLGDKTSQPAPITVTTISKESPWSDFNADMRAAHDFLTKAYSLALESIRMVTGPSLTRRTSICAPNSPLGMGLPKSWPNFSRNCRYRGAATSGLADRL